MLKRYKLITRSTDGREHDSESYYLASDVEPLLEEHAIVVGRQAALLKRCEEALASITRPCATLFEADVAMTLALAVLAELRARGTT